MSSRVRYLPFLLALALICPAFADGNKAPDYLEQKSPFGDPLWMSNREAAPGGILRRDQFSSLALTPLADVIASAEPLTAEQLLAIEKGEKSLNDFPCGGLSILAHNPPHPIQLEELFERSPFVLEGSIVEIQSGFSFGRVSTLYRVKIKRWLKAPAWAEGEEEVLVIFRRGRVLADNRILCREITGRTGEAEIGSRILVLSDILRSNEPLVIGVADSDIYFEAKSGAVSIPRSAPMSSPPDWDFLSKKILLLHHSSNKEEE